MERMGAFEKPEYVPPRGCEYKSLTRNLSIMLWNMCPQGDVSTNLLQEILALCIEYVPPRGCEYKSLTIDLSIMYRVCAPEGI